MLPHQERVVTEHKELIDKTVKLGGFLDSKTFAGLDAAERNCLYRQHEVMQEYCNILSERIAAFV